MTKNMVRMVLVCAAVLLLMTACGGKYDDAVKVHKKFADATENYIGKLEKADSSQDVADAINDFAADIEDITPEMKKIAEKYPELKNPDTVPEELKETKSRMDSVGMKMAQQMMKTAKYMRDAEVRKAQMRLQKALAGFGK